MKRASTIWPATLALAAACLLGATTAGAQTHVFVNNETSRALKVERVDASGDKVSNKAWKRGVSTIAIASRESVLTLKRAGKVNWMDPTPRFIEPGRTAVFTTVISAAGARPLSLKQKLLGTGKTTKMWHTVAGTESEQPWRNDLDSHRARWAVDESTTFDVTYRAYRDKRTTHVEYTISPAR